MGDTGASSASSSDTALPSAAQYVSPDLPNTSSGVATEAKCWSSCDRDSGASQPSRKRVREEEPPNRLPELLHNEVELCPTQHEVLHRVMQSLDPDNSSVVITNPLRRGAWPRERRRPARPKAAHPARPGTRRRCGACLGRRSRAPDPPHAPWVPRAGCPPLCALPPPLAATRLTSCVARSLAPLARSPLALALASWFRRPFRWEQTTRSCT